MDFNGKQRRRISAGTILMLTLTALVLIGFAALLPKLTGNVDISMNAAELAVALDGSLSQLSGALPAIGSQPQNTPINAVNTQVPQPQPTAVPVTPPPKLSFTLSVAGRINLNQAMLKSLTDDTGYKLPILFDELDGRARADLSIATALDMMIPTQKLSDANMPTELADALKGMGLNAVNIASVSVLDGGIDGLSQTKQSIVNAGMLAFGAYSSESERNQIVLVNVKGVKIAVLSYQNDISSAGKKKTSKEERDFALAPCDINLIAGDIAKSREAGAQVVLVSVCWGKASAATPSKEQRELAQLMADAGADIIIGTGSDAVQNVEILTANRADGKYHPTLCAYSMGNLVTYDRDKSSYLAGILLGARIEYDGGTGLVAFDELSYMPTYCWRGKEDGENRYRVLISNLPPASYVDKNQTKVMERCLSQISETMGNGVLSER